MADNVGNATDSLDRGAASAVTVPVVDRVPRLSLESFRDRYFRLKRPVLITEMVREWPAFAKWSFPFFAGLADDRPVTVENGNILQGATDFESRWFRDYVAEIIASGGAPPGTAKDRSYLSLFDIFTQFPALAADVDFALITRLTRWHYVYGWLGPAGTVTGYHIDWIDGILAQIVGRKRVWLVPPEQSRFMYPSAKYDFRSTLSAVDPDGWDQARQPLFDHVRPACVLLDVGQMLYIPRGWWHRVEGLTPSISVNTFGHDLPGILLHQSRAQLRHSLHRLGLVGRQTCTCHKPAADPAAKP